jgi:SAM-dependent methyltransferase
VLIGEHALLRASAPNFLKSRILTKFTWRARPASRIRRKPPYCGQFHPPNLHWRVFRCQETSWTACYHQQMDRSNGYEAISGEFLARRGRSRSTGIGVKEVQKWASTLPRGSSVIDLGCGPGFPITSVLVDEGLHVFGVDASPSFVAAFERNLPGTPIICESVQESKLFDRAFDAVLAWGLMFLFQAEDQRRLIQRFSEVLVPGGRLLFTATAKPAAWIDGMTDLASLSLGTEQYRRLLGAVGISVAEEYEDEGENHYFDAFKGK